MQPKNLSSYIFEIVRVSLGKNGDKSKLIS